MRYVSFVSVWVGMIAMLFFAVATGHAVPQVDDPTRAYRIGVGDTVSVHAFEQDEISGDFMVDESGSITFPLLGTVHVGGMTLVEVSALLERLLEKDYYVDVQLLVEVKDYRSKPVTLLGQIRKPGTYYLQRGQTTLHDILADAGGLSEGAGPTVELRRTEIVDGHEVQNVLTFDTDKLMTGEQGQDVELQEGDVISVTAKRLYFMTGEINRPGEYETTSEVTLMQAMSRAGGLSKFASQTVELHRDIHGEKKILRFDLADIRKGKIDDPRVLAGDIIIVKRRFF